MTENHGTKYLRAAMAEATSLGNLSFDEVCDLWGSLQGSAGFQIAVLRDATADLGKVCYAEVRRVTPKFIKAWWRGLLRS